MNSQRSLRRFSASSALSCFDANSKQNLNAEITENSRGGSGKYLSIRFQIHFLNKFSNACRASLGRRLAGVEVSFSLVTRIS
jgi:hypothetical protein